MRHRRADPLPPDDRRRAIIEAITPLLVAQGTAVTTRQMAEAAGIAEGTIFRVFPDKWALIHGAVEMSMDPAPVEGALAGIDPDAPFEDQITEAARIIVDYFDRVIALITAIRATPSRDHQHHKGSGMPTYVADANAVINRSLTGLFERHRAKMRIEPARAASAFRGLVFANCHPMIGLGETLSNAEIVAILLNGVTSAALEEVG